MTNRVPLTPVFARNEALEAAPRWRREPYLVFFPLGVLLSWAGVGRWLAFALSGRTENYLAVYIFHGMTQIQGFLLCFAMGFLLTMIPRRTASSPPSTAEMVIGLAAPVSTVVAAWMQQWALSQVGWMAACVLLVTFVGRRFAASGGKRRPPTSFVWIPIALLLGLGGSLLTGFGGSFGPDWMWLHNLGQQLVLQGVFVCLVLGVGGFVLPMMTRGEAPGDTTMTGRDLTALAGHVVAAVLLVASFFVQQKVSTSAGCALRAAVITLELLFGPQLWKLPTAPGWNRKMIWVAAWMLPAGFAFAAWEPDWYQAGLHLCFIGGFATLTLAVGTHVVLAHGDRPDLASGKPWQVAAIALLMVAATVSRMLMSIDPMHRDAWMATAAFYFLVATGIWMSFLGPVIVRRKG